MVTADINYGCDSCDATFEISGVTGVMRCPDCLQSYLVPLSFSGHHDV